MNTDYYAVLQVPADSTQDQVHSAYRAMALRHHPDRNPTPESATTMAIINEAYAVLGEAGRRRRYDNERIAVGNNPVALPILAAARDAIVKQRWTILADDGAHLLLEKNRCRVRVILLDRLTNAVMRKLGRQWTEFVVVLALDLEIPLNLALNVAIVDLLHSQRHGAAFPNDLIQGLFACFLKK